MSNNPHPRRWLSAFAPDRGERRDGAELIERLEAERATLVSGCIEVGDLIDSQALRRKLLDALFDVGVLGVDATGEPFDAREHRAVDSVATDEPSLHGRIAATERQGYRDRGRLLRRADVSVYRLAAPPAAGQGPAGAATEPRRSSGGRTQPFDRTHTATQSEDR